MTFVEVAKEADFADNQGKVVEVQGKQIALYKREGKFYALENECKHQGGSLGEGFIEEKNVVCPLHGWKYNIETGDHAAMPNQKIEIFETKVEDGKVFIDV